jgi:hypothetical protein
MRWARIVLLAAVLAVAGCDAVKDVVAPGSRYSEAAFRRWLAAESGRAGEFRRFERFLADHGVSGVVPAWQLLRTDANYAGRCGLDAFQMPPEQKWPAIVPALRLVRDDVIPVVGRVEVSASHRSDELNACVHGARGSRHLAFAAVDLVAPDRPDQRQLFADLCAMHQRVGARDRMGLGAYYDPARPFASRHARFHIDQSGYRTWGFDYTRKSSYCLKLA